MSQQATTQIQGASKSYCYVPVREIRESDELGTYTTFGISACLQTEDGLRMLDYVSDISTDGEAVTELAQSCTLGGLDPIHLRDVVEDFLAA